TGAVRKGDGLVIEPAGREVRVREVQSFDTAVKSAAAGTRTALALHGVRVDEVVTGSQVLTPRVLESSSMLNAFVETSTLSGSRLRNRQRLRFHHAAAEIMARVVLLDSKELEIGENGFVQLRLEKPTVARRGDRFVLRSYSPMRVIAGGKILDPDPAKAKRFRKETIHTLKTLDEGSNRDVILTLASLGGSRGIAPDVLRRYGMVGAKAEDECRALEHEGLIYKVGNRVIEAGVLRVAEEKIAGVLEEFASRNRLLWGMEKGELREKTGLGEGLLFDFLVEKGKREGRFFVKGARVRAGSGERELSPDDVAVLAELEKRIRGCGLTFPGRADLFEVVRDEKRLILYLHILQENGSIVRISSEGFLHLEHQEELIGRLRSHIAGGGALSVGDFKEIFGLSRKYAVPLLEYLDREGFTRREGDVRVAGPRLLRVQDGG
ncbi:MAG: SelB C-terminal domain-containing protein, partial [Candidatus Krumholzibacteria bacterium]|nr:SelB C-terminal domain-containing protein [Candidatus Krumholzibacteria bacterium]